VEQIYNFQYKNNGLAHDEEVLPDDLVTNNKIIEIFKLTHRDKVFKCESMNKREFFSSLYENFKLYFHMIKIELNTFASRIKLLFLRFSDIINGKSKYQFSYLSCQKHEEQTFDNIVGTYKEVYCNVCRIYSCFHSIGTKQFDNPENYNINGYTCSYRSILDFSYRRYSKNSPDSDMRKELTELVVTFNTIIQNHNLTKHESLTKITEATLSEDQLPEDYKPCSSFCYKNFLHLNEEKKNEIYILYKNYKMKPIAESYIMKLCEIFKYDPCNIRLFLSQFYQIDYKNIECTIIYFFLLNINFENLINKNMKYFSCWTKKKSCKKKKRKVNQISGKRLKHINRYFEESKK
jgi:hypothetical protein